MSNVVKLHPAKDPDEVLREAIGNYTAICIVGWNQDREMDIRADLNISVSDAHMLLAVAQAKLVEFMLEEE